MTRSTRCSIISARVMFPFDRCTAARLRKSSSFSDNDFPDIDDIPVAEFDIATEHADDDSRPSDGFPFPTIRHDGADK